MGAGRVMSLTELYNLCFLAHASGHFHLISQVDFFRLLVFFLPFISPKAAFSPETVDEKT